MYIPQNIPRQKQFMFQEPANAQARFGITEQEESADLGRRIGSVILSLCRRRTPVKGVYVFGRIGIGKTILSTNLVKSFDDAEDLLVDIKHRVLFRKYSCWPAVYAYDCYSRRDPFGVRAWNRNIGKFPAMGQEEMILVQWAEWFPKERMEADRIEIELMHCMDEKELWTRPSMTENAEDLNRPGTMRFASMCGYGNGCAAVEMLK